MNIENVVLKRFVINKKDLVEVLKNKPINVMNSHDLRDFRDDEIFLFDEFTAYDLGLITRAESDMMLDHNTRVTLNGLKKHHWKQLVNTESDKGYWDITFRGKTDIEFSKFNDEDRVSSMIITEEEFVDLIDLVKKIS